MEEKRVAVVVRADVAAVGLKAASGVLGVVSVAIAVIAVENSVE